MAKFCQIYRRIPLAKTSNHSFSTELLNPPEPGAAVTRITNRVYYTRDSEQLCNRSCSNKTHTLSAWWLGLAPATLEFWVRFQTRGTRENRRTLC